MVKLRSHLNYYIFTFYFLTLSFSFFGQYCPPPAENTQYEWIEEYSFIPSSDQVNISIDVGGTFVGDLHYVFVFVDLDQDGTIYETRYDLGSISLDGSLISNFTFSSSDFISGETYNYRIYMSYNAPSTGPCDPIPTTSNWGATVDDSFTYNTALPIELLLFTAKPKETFVQLDWVTSLEINNDFFQVERSTNGLDWEVVVEMEGAGISIELLSYIALDSDPVDGMSFYRLKQVDFDGQYSYSDVEAVFFDKKNEDISSLIVFPNPNNGRFNLKFSNFNEHAIQLMILNQQGQILWKNNVLLSDGYGLFEVSEPIIMKPGSYILIAQSEDGTQNIHRKIVVQ